MTYYQKGSFVKLKKILRNQLRIFQVIFLKRTVKILEAENSSASQKGEKMISTDEAHNTEKLIVTYNLTSDDYFVFNKFMFIKRQSWQQRWGKRILFSLLFPFLFSIYVMVYELFFCASPVNLPLYLSLTIAMFSILLLLYPIMVDSKLKRLIKKYPELIDNTGNPYGNRELRLKERSISIFDGTDRKVYNLSKDYTMYLVKERLIIRSSVNEWELIPLNQFSQNEKRIIILVIKNQLDMHI